MDNKLSREKIIDAAFQLLEETPDIEKLSMRNIAKRIGVQAPALYWYFQNKQALLQSMAEEIERQFETPVETTNWKQTIFSYMENYYELYQKFPCSLEIEMNTIPSSPLRLTRYNTLLGILRNAGFSVEASYTAINGLQHLLFGLLIDISEEKQLYSRILDGDKYLNQQVVLMKQYITDNQLTYVEEGFAYRQQKKQKDTFKRMINLFLDSLEIENTGK
jgi:hypothetical protein